MPSPFELILFDLGNTLSYFHGDWDQTIDLAIGKMDYFLKEKGILESKDVFAPIFSDAMKKYYITRDIDCVETTTAILLRDLLLDKFQIALPEAIVQSALKVFYNTTGQHWRVDEYAIETLQTLQLAGYHIGLISNASHAPDVYQQINEQKLAPFFEIVLISAETGIRKPHPAIFQMALDHFGFPPAKALMVGDTLNADILGSRKMGIKNVWARRWTSPTSTHTHDDAIIPDKTIQYLFELPPLLEWWSQTF